MKTTIKVSVYFLLVLSACKIMPEQNPTEKIDNFNNGFFVLNEGTYGFGNASVSFFDKSAKAIKNDIFKLQNNGLYLGDQAQDMVLFNQKGYIVVQNSKKIEVVDILNFKQMATIKSDLISSPRYFLPISKTTAFVSDWDLDGVSKINLISNTTEKIIKTGRDPEKMQLVGNNLFVCNSGYGAIDNEDNTVSVIDIESESVVKNITVGWQPMDIVQDKLGLLWIGCRGKKKYDASGNIDAAKSEKSSLWKINSSTFEATLIFEFSERQSWIEKLTLSNEKQWLYYAYAGRIYVQNTTQNFSLNMFLDKKIYAMGIDSENGNLIVGIENGFTSAGKILRYDIFGDTFKKVIDSATVGVLPNKFVMK